MRRAGAVIVALGCFAAVLGAGGGAAAVQSAAPPAWPVPLSGATHSAFDFVHYGEGHHNEDGGPVVNGEIFRQTNLYGAAFLAFSSDMATNGSPAELQSFENYIDEGYSPLCPKGTASTPCQSALAVPWFHAPGNHDRLVLIGPGGVLSFTNDVYRDVFRDNTYPWGENPASLPPGFGAPTRTTPGAATHYYVDYGPVRLIAVDNSCHSLTMCDLFSLVEQGGGPAAGQNPPVGPAQADASQLEFMARVAGEASAAGRLAFVFMHEPTQDPRYPPHVNATSANHTMNKGATSDNAAFESLAAASGVDGVLTGHIKGNATYRGVGDVPYYIDGGGGGAPYTRTNALTGVDQGYYYAYRVFRIVGGAVAHTWLVPVLQTIELYRAGSPVSGAISLPAGATLDLDATGVAPKCVQPPVCSNQTIRVELRPPHPPMGFEAATPTPAYVWHSSDTAVLAPEGSRTEPGFDAATMSAEGRFRALSPGTATVTIAAGWRRAQIVVTVTP